MPKLSVITINYNDAPGLERTIQSVVSQEFSDLEFIIIDGGSNDESIAVIDRHKDKISQWVSEKDKGIYDAQNKGASKATGDYLLFLNSGDCFYDEHVLRNFDEFSLNNPKKVIYGNTKVIEPDGSSYFVCPPEKLDIDFWYANTLNHQSLFTHRSLFQKYGNFNAQLKYAADFDLLFRIYIKEPSEFMHFDQMVCNYDNTGLTSKDEYHKMIIRERKQVLLTHIGKRKFNEMRSAYLKTLPFKRKYMVIIRENKLLRTMLKPFYKFYKFFTK